MSSSLLSYPDSINFKTGELGSESTTVKSVLVVIAIAVLVCILIMRAPKRENENLLDLIEQ